MAKFLKMGKRTVHISKRNSREILIKFLNQKMPGICWPVEAYAQKAVTKPSIAAQPLKFSASGVTTKWQTWRSVNACIKKYKPLHLAVPCDKTLD